MAFSAGSEAPVARETWAARAWLRVVTLGYGHAIAWAFVALTAIAAYWSTLEAGADAAEQRAAQQLAQDALARAESDYERIEKLLREASELPYPACSSAQIEALSRLDFEVNEVKEFGLFDALGRLVCTSRSGTLPNAYDVPTPDATYGEIQVNAALLPLLSNKSTVYMMRYRAMNALADPKRWGVGVDGKNFGLRITDLQSGQEVLKIVDDTDHPRHYSAQGTHFVVTVESTGTFAQHWLASRKAWVLPLLAFAGVCAALVAWLLVSRVRSPLSRLERVIRFHPENVRLVYQPVVGIDKAQVVGTEALLRLRGENDTLIPPAAVFGVLEREASLCQRLTALVLDHALRDLKDWLAEDRKRFLGVNLTQHDLDDDSLPGRVSQLLKRYQVQPAQLHLELLETSKLADERTVRVLQALRDIGCELWIDDFGVGYSNLARLHTLPVHGVKLDREWVEALDDSQHVRTDAVAHLVLFAGSNGLGIIAEGVSDELAMRTLLRLGVQQMQGFLFAPGLPLKELLQLSDASVSVGAPRTLRGELDKMRT